VTDLFPENFCYFREILVASSSLMRIIRFICTASGSSKPSSSITLNETGPAIPEPQLLQPLAMHGMRMLHLAEAIMAPSHFFHSRILEEREIE